MNTNNQQDAFLFNTTPTSQNTLQTLMVEKERLIVPIIFLPGVMGSNLKAKPLDSNDTDTDKIWRLDGAPSALGWALPHYGNAQARKLELDPNKTDVDARGKVIDASKKEVGQIKQKYDTQLLLLGNDKMHRNDVRRLKQERLKKIEEAIKNTHENRLFGSRQERGWGSAGYISYGEFLDTFQQSLFEPKGHTPPALNKLLQAPLFTLDEGSKTSLIPDDKQIKHCNNFYFPVHVMGYNWLQSNEESANALKKLVEITLPAYYKKRGQTCDKVVLVTHSMGGLVARYYTQALDGEKKVYGVINGVQPSIGAAAAYARMKRGTEVNSTFLGKLPDSIMENVLGKDAAEMTAVCAQSPGPLQLLPTAQYGMGWLTITHPDGEAESYPKSDPYEEIYLAKDKWWCVCEPHLINPLNKTYNLVQMEKDWQTYKDIITNEAKTFNEDIANRYHPKTYAFFGLEKDDRSIRTEFLTYKTAHWQGSVKNGNKTASAQHIGDKRRLNLKELSNKRTIQNGTINEEYTFLPADGNGDGTVPLCSGEIPMDYLTARLRLPIGHEPAYKSDISQDFTLRAIVNIMQEEKCND